MVYFENNKWHFSTKQVTYTEDGKTITKAVGSEGVEWWNEFVEKWKDIGKVKFEDVTATAEQKKRLTEVNGLGIGDGFSSVISDYVINNTFPDEINHPLQNLEFKNQQTKQEEENAELKEALTILVGGPSEE